MKVIRLKDSWHLEPEDLVDRIFLEEFADQYELHGIVSGLGRDPEFMQVIHVQLKFD